MLLSVCLLAARLLPGVRYVGGLTPTAFILPSLLVCCYEVVTKAEVEAPPVTPAPAWAILKFVEDWANRMDPS